MQNYSSFYSKKW